MVITASLFFCYKRLSVSTNPRSDDTLCPTVSCNPVKLISTSSETSTHNKIKPNPRDLWGYLQFRLCLWGVHWFPTSFKMFPLHRRAATDLRRTKSLARYPYSFWTHRLSHRPHRRVRSRERVLPTRWSRSNPSVLNLLASDSVTNQRRTWRPFVRRDSVVEMNNWETMNAPTAHA